LNAVDRTKAGVASGTLSMSRMVGGTFGVAALGALIAAVGRSELARDLPALPEAARDRIVEGLGSGGAAAGGAPPEVVAAARDAFVSALVTGLAISAAAALASAAVAWWLIDPRAGGGGAGPVAPADPLPDREPARL
jgi:hypothetical protein